MQDLWEDVDKSVQSEEPYETCTHNTKALSCEDCGKQFTLPNSLDMHRLKHHTSFPQDCEDYGKLCGTRRAAHKIVLPATSPSSTQRTERRKADEPWKVDTQPLLQLQNHTQLLPITA